MSEQLNLVNEHYKCFKMSCDDTYSYSTLNHHPSPNPTYVPQRGVVTCHLANFRLLLSPTAVVKIFQNGTAGEDSFPGRSVIAIGACIMMLFSPVGKRARNMSSSVYGLRGVLLSKKIKKKGEKMHLVISSTEYKF